jgi:hypothetical protein
MDLREESRRLRDLATAPPTPEVRSDVMQSLHSKWEGIQAVAAKVLGAWGDPQSKAGLRQWFLEAIDRPLGWSVRSVAARELARLMTADDTEWVLDLYFGTNDAVLHHPLLRLAASLPAVPAKEAVIAKARTGNASERLAALEILVWSSWGQPRDLLRPFARDPDPVIQIMLRAWGAV